MLVTRLRVVDQATFGACGTATANQNHDLYWSGTAGRYIDLQNVMPATFVYTEAYSIVGNAVYGVAEDTSGNYHAIAWTVTAPEANNLIYLSPAGVKLISRRRRQHCGQCVCWKMLSSSNAAGVAATAQLNGRDFVSSGLKIRLLNGARNNTTRVRCSNNLINVTLAPSVCNIS